jgi:thiamine pyrophosphate-dependent acetolactate synthase large subunit-like protein
LAGDTPAAALTSNFRIDQDGLVESVGAIAERIYSPASALSDAARALRRASLERRPVVLNMPIDMQAAPAVAASPPAAPVPAPPAPAGDDIAVAARLIAGARRPAFIAGRGAVIADAGPVIERLGAACGALLANTAVANGIFDGQPYGLGIAGGFATPLALELLPQADVVVAFGASLNGWTTRHGTLIGPDAKLIQVDVDARALGAHRPVDLGIVADAGEAAVALLRAVTDLEVQAEGFEQLRERIAASRWRDEPFSPSGAAGVIDPRTLSIALAEMLPHDKGVVIDSGHFTGWPAMYLDVADPRAWLFVNGFQAVGLGLGCAIGAAVAHPERITVAALGDGGLFLSLAELDSAARAGVRLLIVVYDDAAYGAEVHHFGPMGHDTATVRFPDADLAAIAAAAGVPSVTVRSVEDLAPLADWISGASGPMLVDAKVDPTICADWLVDAFR